MPQPIRISDFGDHRNTEQLERARALAQALADQALEAEWRHRVAENIRRRLAAKVDLIAVEVVA